MNDLLELEIAFTALSKTLIAALLHPDPPTGERLAASLATQAGTLRGMGGDIGIGAASQLDRLAVFALDRQSQLLVLQADTPSAH